MTKNLAIRVKGLGKKYHIGGPKEKYHSLREAIINAIESPFDKLVNSQINKPSNEFWALKDVSFDVQKGEMIGIIGQNGAGKSTLLKILSRITTPTEGEVELYGRVGSLLEVGTGFHPELTGRENIFLSGSIIGMKKREIEDKFDEIVKFSEIEKFIDTPVKRYSSGMYVRLAFAVAAHLDPEILIIDEVLAVGDAAFQKKCLGKMGDVAREGRTVLFVSHNMGAVAKLVNTCIYLEKGKIRNIGPTSEIINQYLCSNYPFKPQTRFEDDPKKDTQIQEIIIRNITGEKSSYLNPIEPFLIEAHFIVRRPIRQMHIAIMIETTDGIPISHSDSSEDTQIPITWKIGSHSIQVCFPGGILNFGQYILRVGIGRHIGTAFDPHRDGLRFEISEGGKEKELGVGLKKKPGILLIKPKYYVLSNT
nr:ABC transporter ATP-binding protein [uncultured Methanospirillum sp.]